jgi:hypothetical protein
MSCGHAGGRQRPQARTDSYLPAAELGVMTLRSSPAREKRRAASPGYFRSALTYMLISMPTCTSTIRGVFQVIRVLLCHLGNCQGLKIAT